MKRFLPLAAAAFACATGAWAQELKPGLYRQETIVNVPGMTARPQASQECVTRKDIEEGLVRLGQDKDEPCKASEVKRSPGKVSYRMACEDSTAVVDGTLQVTRLPVGDAPGRQVVGFAPSNGEEMTGREGHEPSRRPLEAP
jgi:hypothetical protein